MDLLIRFSSFMEFTVMSLVFVKWEFAFDYFYLDSDLFQKIY